MRPGTSVYAVRLTKGAKSLINDSGELVKRPALIVTVTLSRSVFSCPSGINKKTLFASVNMFYGVSSSFF